MADDMIYELNPPSVFEVWAAMDAHANSEEAIKARIESSRKWYAGLSTVGELIEQLSKYPADWKVVCDDDGRPCGACLSDSVYESRGEAIGPMVTLNG